MAWSPVRKALRRASKDAGVVKVVAVVAGAAAVVAGAAAGARTARSRRPSRAYRLTSGETLPEGLARVAQGRIDHAIDELQGKTKRSPDEAVHEARKDMKKLRSVLRLARGELGGKLYREQNAAIRDAARGLAGVRDAQVVIEALDTLAKEGGAELPMGAVKALRAALVQRRRELKAGSAGRADAAAEAIAALRKVREQVDEWPLDSHGFDAVEPGLRRIYRQGRRRFRDARKKPTTENLHEWRKRVKDLWYHQQLLTFVWPELLKPAADEAHRLSELLGEDHDLAVLADAVDIHAEAVPDGDDRSAIHRVIAARRSKLQKEACGLGRRAYAERPKAFIRRIDGWFEAA